MKRILVSLLLAVCASGAQAWTLDRVVDGDTVSLVDGSRTVRFRLACIDADEHDQPYGRRATQALDALLRGKTIDVQAEGSDRYGRSISYLYVNGEDINLTMVSIGMAFVFPRYCHLPQFYAAEAAARAGRVGVWADDDPERPWAWRKTQRGGK
ncbi:thermonuclease family protein [Paraburkholderia sediminicola]|uniref:thermonuclease family protein n=1 Tax=Paraburkholderia sediminicola TaxID=458836 RepID=UPI0038BE19A8